MHYMNKMQFINLYILKHFTSYSCVKRFVRLHAYMAAFLYMHEQIQNFFPGRGGGLGIFKFAAEGGVHSDPPIPLPFHPPSSIRL